MDLPKETLDMMLVWINDAVNEGTPEAKQEAIEEIVKLADPLIREDERTRRLDQATHDLPY